MAIPTTTIQGKVLMPDGTDTTGTILASLSAPGTVTDDATADVEIVAGRFRGSIVAGVVTGLALVPNDEISPAGSHYRFSFEIEAPAKHRYVRRLLVPSAPDPVDIGALVEAS